MRIDVRLNAIVDAARAGERPLAALAQAVAAGGATLVQLRDKRGATRVLVEEARAIAAALAPLATPFVVNDRVDVALAGGAHGVHLGPDDMAVADARALLGARAIIGLSIKSAAQAEAAPLDLVDYVGVGGVYATSSKDNPEPPLGCAGLRAVISVLRRRAPALPALGIGGIDASNAAEAIAAGADGVAVISALTLAADPRSAAQALRAVVDGALAMRARS